MKNIDDKVKGKKRQNPLPEYSLSDFIVLRNLDQLDQRAMIRALYELRRRIYRAVAEGAKDYYPKKADTNNDFLDGVDYALYVEREQLEYFIRTLLDNGNW